MMIRSRPRFFRLLFFVKGSIFRGIALQLIGVFLFSLAIVSILPRFAVLHNTAVAGFRAVLFTLPGIVIAAALGFRYNACYNRWREARHQFTQMIGEMRSLGRLATSLLPDPAHLLRAAIAFTYALNAQLRNTVLPPEFFDYLAPEDIDATAISSNVPSHLLTLMAEDSTCALRSGALTDILYASIDERLSTIANSQAACERIATPPAYSSYTLLLHYAVCLFCYLLPLAVAPSLGFATPVFCTLVAYAFLGLEALSDELEDPFGDHSNTLPVDALSGVIEVDLLEALKSADQLRGSRGHSGACNAVH